MYHSSVDQCLCRLRAWLHLLLCTPTHAYHDLSPGLDFESRLFAKPDAAELLRAELGKPGYRVAPIALGTNTDPYQPIEGEWRITRAILEVLAETNHPVAITTKSDRVVRDIDILAPMAAKGLATVCVSVTSLDAKVARTVEPRAPTPERRLAAVTKLTEAASPPMSRSRPSSLRSPITRSSIWSSGRQGLGRAMPSSFPFACRTKSHRCSAPGWPSISPIGRAR